MTTIRYYSVLQICMELMRHVAVTVLIRTIIPYAAPNIFSSSTRKNEQTSKHSITLVVRLQKWKLRIVYCIATLWQLFFEIHLGLGRSTQFTC
jgi:hypothetical protein